MQTALTAGVARELINPALGTYLAGYGHPWRGCRSIRDDLTATALVLDDGDTRVGIVGIDQLAIHESIVARIRSAAETEAGIPTGHLLIGCSHSHCSPVGSAFDDSSEAQRTYVDSLVERVTAALRAAAAALRPATLRAGRGESDINVNRRQSDGKGSVKIGAVAEGPVDRTIGLLQVVEAGSTETLLATVVNFTCHPTILSPKHKFATAGWPAVMRRTVEAQIHSPVLFLQGATGDINPDHDWGRGELEALERLGRRVGESVLEALPTLQPVSGTPLAATRAPVWLTLVPEPHPRTGRPMGYRRALQRQIPVPGFVVDWLMRRCYPWRNAVETRDGGHPAVPMEAQALRLGDVAVVAQAAEVFHEIGAAVKDGSPAQVTLFAGYANGMIGYLPTAEEHARGGYEVDVAPYFYRFPGRLHPDSGERAADASSEQLQALFSR